MRKKLLHFVACTTLLFLFSCKKEIQKQNSESDTIQSRINSWIESKKYPIESRHNKKLAELKANLDFNNVTIEKKNEKECFVIVPLGANYITENNKGVDPVNSLVLLMRSGQIVNGGVLQYVPKSGERKLEANTVLKINSRGSDVPDGKYTMLNLVDVYQYELQYEQGKLKSFSSMESKNNDRANQNRDGEVCTEWWLKTTYIYADGHTEVEWTYLGRTCDCGLVGPNGQSGLCDEIINEGGGDLFEVVETIIEPHSDSDSQSYGEQTTDPNTGKITQQTAWDWRCGTGTTKIKSEWFNWEYWSNETGVIYKNNQNDVWKIESIAHQGINRIGQTPPTHTYTQESNFFYYNHIPNSVNVNATLKFSVYETINLGAGSTTKSWSETIGHILKP